MSEQSDQTAKSRLSRLAGILCHLILVVALTGLARAQEDLEFLEREAALFTDASKIPQAEAMLERKLALQEKSLGPNNPDVATTLFELVRLYRKQDDREREQQAATRALKIREGTLGPVSLKVAESLEQLATCKNLPEHSLLVAIADLNRALVIREKALPPNDPQIAQILMDLGDKSIDTDKKEKDYLKAEAILEKSAPESDMMLTVLVDLSSFYRETGSLKNADEMMRRYTELSNKRYGIGRGGLILYRERDQSTNAAKLIAEGDSLCRETFSTNHEWMFYSTHPDLMFLATHHYQSFFNICSVTDRSRAEGLYQSALREEIGHLNADFRTTWEIRKRLLTLYLSTGRFDKAEPVYRDSLAYWKTHPPEPYVVDSEYPRNIENNYFREEMTSFCFELAHYNKPQWARPIAEMLRRRYLDRLRQNADQEDQNSSRRSAALVLNENLKILWTIAHHPDLDDAPGSAANEAFMVADQVRIGAAGAALTRAALRAQPNDAASSAAERQREELVAQLRSLKNREAVWQTRPDYYRKELDTNTDSAREIARNIDKLTEQIYLSSPYYSREVIPDPIDAEAVQKLLRPHEALISYAYLENKPGLVANPVEPMLCWLVTADHPVVYRTLDIRVFDLQASIRHLRESLGSDKAYDVADAHALYVLLLQPFEGELKSVDRLFVVPDEMLLPIPFAALLTRGDSQSYLTLVKYYSPQASLSSQDLALYRKLPWLVRERYALTILPSATSLKVLREQSRRRRGIERFIGIGDPTLHGGGSLRGGSMLATRGLDALKKIRELPPLPGAHAELKAEALAMGVDPKEALFTQDKATKPQVMILNDKRLADVQIVAFATHALVGGEIEGEKEPALVLTPPKVDSDADNGLLTLDDILGLRLDSDRLVLLSACDTAAPDGSGEGFSGLTSAFFFAGAPALLVSQWGVDDSATRHLMTDLLKKKDFVTRPSSALKSAMIDMIASTRAKRSFSNPFAWAAFILVGDDGRYRVPAFRTGKP